MTFITTKYSAVIFQRSVFFTSRCSCGGAQIQPVPNHPQIIEEYRDGNNPPGGRVKNSCLSFKNPIFSGPTKRDRIKEFKLWRFDAYLGGAAVDKALKSLSSTAAYLLRQLYMLTLVLGLQVL